MADRRAYMREYMKARRAAEKAGQRPSKQAHETPEVDEVDTSTSQPVEVIELGPAPTPATVAAIKAPFLRALVDDCLTCGHEWHSNEDGGCKAATGPRDRCGCKAYLDAGTPF